MAIIKWEPFDELDRFFDDFPRLPMRMKGFVPALDLYEDKDNLMAETALPGIDPNDVEVTVANDVLTVKGGSQKQSEVEEKNYYRKEVRGGSFYRQVALPMHVAGEKTKAEYANGILKITMPKAPEIKAKTVKVAVTQKSKKAKK